MEGKPSQGFVYTLPPIDWWPAWSDLDGALANVKDLMPGVRQQFRTRLERIRDHALEEFRRRTYWEGDITNGPFFAGLPQDEEESEVMVAIKQSNNGSVFIWSPFELPWLKKYAE